MGSSSSSLVFFKQMKKVSERVQVLDSPESLDSLMFDFFSDNKNILKIKKGWEKIGLWIPLNVFFQIRTF